MSTDVFGTTIIKNVEILEQTLTELGISHTKKNDHTVETIGGSRYDTMCFDLESGKVKYDSMRSHELDRVKQGYSKNFILAEVRKKGHHVQSVNTVNNQIEIIASY